MHVNPKVPMEWGGEVREPARKLLCSSGLKGWGGDRDESGRCFQGETKLLDRMTDWLNGVKEESIGSHRLKASPRLGGAVEIRWAEKTLLEENYLFMDIWKWGGGKGSSFIHSTNTYKLRGRWEQWLWAILGNRLPEFKSQFCYFMLGIGPTD